MLAGDGRLLERLRSEELLPLGSRIRVRLALERATPDELQECLEYAHHQGRRRQAHDARAHRHALAITRRAICVRSMNMAGELLASRPPSAKPGTSTRSCSWRPIAPNPPPRPGR